MRQQQEQSMQHRDKKKKPFASPSRESHLPCDEGCAPSSGSGSGSGSSGDKKTIMAQLSKKIWSNPKEGSISKFNSEICSKRQIDSEGVDDLEPHRKKERKSDQMMPDKKPESSNLKKPSKKSASSTSSEHADRDGVDWGSTRNRKEVRNVKDYHDSVIHKAVLDNNFARLRDMLRQGLVSFGKSIDGATPLHRAAEIGSIACAEVLLEFNADIDARNLAGETSFHVAALNKQVEFGRFLLDRKAKSNCKAISDSKQSCSKCRFLNQMVIRLRNTKRQQEDSQKAEQEEAQKELDLETEKKREKRKQRRLRKKQRVTQPEEDAPIDFQATLEQYRKELGGPFLSKAENKKLKEEQRKERRLVQEQERRAIDQHQRMQHLEKPNQQKRPGPTAWHQDSISQEQLISMASTSAKDQKTKSPHIDEQIAMALGSGSSTRASGENTSWVRSQIQHRLRKPRVHKADNTSDEGEEAPFIKAEDPESSNSGDETNEDEEGVSKMSQKFLWDKPNSMQEVSKKQRQKHLMAEELKRLDSSSPDDPSQLNGKAKVRESKKRRIVPMVAELSDDDFADLDY